jgi:hypothetical protein
MHVALVQPHRLTAGLRASAAAAFPCHTLRDVGPYNAVRKRLFLRRINASRCRSEVRNILALAKDQRVALPDRSKPAPLRPVASPRTWPQLTVGGELGPARTAPTLYAGGTVRRRMPTELCALRSSPAVIATVSRGPNGDGKTCTIGITSRLLRRGPQAVAGVRGGETWHLRGPGVPWFQVFAAFARTSFLLLACTSPAAVFGRAGTGARSGRLHAAGKTGRNTRARHPKSKGRAK